MGQGKFRPGHNQLENRSKSGNKGLHVTRSLPKCDDVIIYSESHKDIGGNDLFAMMNIPTIVGIIVIQVFHFDITWGCLPGDGIKSLKGKDFE
jgi:hypothetical protein